MLEQKKKQLLEIEKEILLENIDNLWDFIIDRCNDLWSPELKGRIDFLSLLTNFERVIVKLGNFNYQVLNGGFSQWYENGFYSDSEEVLEFVKTSDFAHKTELIEILENCNLIINSIEKLNTSDDFYLEDYNTRLKMLDENNENYSKLSEELGQYVENYIYENLPQEYIDKLKEYNKIQI